MRPFHIGLLVAAGALGGALLMKWQSSGPPEPARVTASAPAVPAPLPTPAVTPAEPAAPEPPAARPVEPVPAKPSAARRKPQPKPRPEPAVIAQAQPAHPDSKPAPQAPAAAPVPAATPDPGLQPIQQPNREPIIPPPPPEPNRVTLAAGTTIPVRVIEALSSERNSVGDTFTATLDAPLVVDGFAIAERGARVEGKVVEAVQAGKVSGVATLGIVLTQITTSDGQRIRIETQPFTKNAQTSHRQDAAKVGAGAGLGAIIGAIAGGGKGAGIGAAAGGAAGAGTVLLTRGKQAELPSETRINFRLSAPVTVTERR